MAGKMGNAQVTIKNLQVIAVNKETNEIEIASPVPGKPGDLLRIVRLSAGVLEGIHEVEAQVVEGEAPAGEATEGEAPAEAPKEGEVASE